jgi:hypothetical protein
MVLALFVAKIMLGIALPTSVLFAYALAGFAMQVLLTVVWVMDARGIESKSRRTAWIACVVLGGTLGQLVYISDKFGDDLRESLGFGFGASESAEDDQDSW